MRGKCIAAIVIVLLASCQKKSSLEWALQAAGQNRAELERVLDHYADDPEKRAAAEYIISNLPAHYSYGTDSIDLYYDYALRMFRSGLDPDRQNDSLLAFSRDSVPDLTKNTVCDAECITSDYLIYSIDHAFLQWKQRPWAAHVGFDEFCEWLLPYKAVELQSLDHWRDTLPAFFSEYLQDVLVDDVEYNTAFRTLDYVRNELIDKIHMHGIYSESCYPMLSASTMARQTFGRCADYVHLAVLTYRSLGLPVAIDETPYWGRFRSGHAWYILLGDRGQELPAEWDLGSVPGWGFFPYERIPKVYRNTFAMDPDRVRYARTAKYRYPFNLCQKDVTDHYMKTSDLEIPITKGGQLKDRYCYIATFNGRKRAWGVVDFGRIRHGKACFHDMGRNILYIAMGYNGKNLVEISDPFILRKDDSIEYIIPQTETRQSIEIRRKYLENANVALMRLRLLGGRIECASRPDFADAHTLFTIESTRLEDRTPLPDTGRWRYWRYVGADGTYGSLAELAFFDADGNRLEGKIIGDNSIPHDVLAQAFDDNWLTNCESENENGAWVGLDMGHGVRAASVRIVPRSDDNDIHPGDRYELKYWDGNNWVSTGERIAEGNSLTYDNIPAGALMWLSDYTQGWDERAFRFLDDGTVEWW